MSTVFYILTLSILTENYVLARFLGICPFLGVSKKLNTAVGMSLAVIFVMVLATAVTYPIFAWVLCPLGLSYLQTIVFILVIAGLVQFVEIVLRKYIPSLYKALGIYLPLITTNCAVLGVTLLHFTKGYNYGEAMINAVGSGVGFLLAMVLFAGVRERMERCNVPKFLKGLPITLIAASLVALPFTGFAGIANAFKVTINPVEYTDKVNTGIVSQFVIPVAILAAIGLIVGVGLSVASSLMSVPVNKKTAEVRDALPGANCGSCGFSGCDGYAEAISEGTTDNITLCAPGGPETVEKISAIMGIDAVAAAKKKARVHCLGTLHNTGIKFDYNGIKTCSAAAQIYGGPRDCSYACIGYGDCEKACPYGAISVCDGAAVVNPAVCTGCGICVGTCPKNIISLEPEGNSKSVLCSNKDTGARVRKVCEVGCIGCGLCVKACEFSAISVVDKCAVIDPDKCTGCGKCADACVRGIIH